jgi:hypothetical protein
LTASPDVAETDIALNAVADEGAIESKLIASLGVPIDLLTLFIDASLASSCTALSTTQARPASLDKRKMSEPEQFQGSYNPIQI